MRRRYKLIQFCALFIAAILFIEPGVMDVKAARDAAQLGDINHYSAIIFEDLVSKQADIEGAAAVGGNAAFGMAGYGFDMGGASLPYDYFMGNYTNPKNYPTFLLGGTLINEGTRVGIFGGPPVLKNSYRTDFEGSGFGFDSNYSTEYAEDEDILKLFGKMKNIAENTSQVLWVGNDKTITTEELKDLRRITLSEHNNRNIDTSAKVLVLNIEPSEELKIGEVNLPPDILNYDVIIFNAPAKSITFTGGAVLYDGRIIDTNASGGSRGFPQENAQLKSITERIIWNLPQAEYVEVNAYGVIGSVLAPKAHVTGIGGSINGKLICDTFTQTKGMEVHGFSIANSIWKWTRKIPKEKSYSIMIKKVDSDTLSPIGDVRFSIEKENNLDWEKYTTSELLSDLRGFSEPAELTEGKYRIKETAPPAGYIGMADYIYFELDEDLNIMFESLPDGVATDSDVSESSAMVFTVKNQPDGSTGPTKPSEPPTPSESETPSESPRETEPSEPSESPTPSESETPSESPRATEPSKPSESPRETEPSKPSESPKATEPPKPSESPRETEPSKPSESPRATEPSKPSESPRATEPPKLSEPVKPHGLSGVPIKPPSVLPKNSKSTPPPTTISAPTVPSTKSAVTLTPLNKEADAVSKKDSKSTGEMNKQLHKLNSTPKTGDSMSLITYMYTAILTISGLILVIVLARKKRK